MSVKISHGEIPPDFLKYCETIINDTKLSSIVGVLNQINLEKPLYQMYFMGIDNRYTDIPKLSDHPQSVCVLDVLKNHFNPRYVTFMFQVIYKSYNMRAPEDCEIVFNYLNPFLDTPFGRFLNDFKCVATGVRMNYMVFWMEILFFKDKALFFETLKSNFERFRRDKQEKSFISFRELPYENRNFEVRYFLRHWIGGTRSQSFEVDWTHERKDVILDILRIIHPACLDGIFDDVCKDSADDLIRDCTIEVLTTIITEFNYNCSRLSCFDITKIRPVKHDFVNCKALENESDVEPHQRIGDILNFKAFRDVVYPHCYGFQIAFVDDFSLHAGFTKDALNWLIVGKRINMLKDISLNHIIPKLYELYEEDYYTRLINVELLYRQILAEINHQPTGYLQIIFLTYLVKYKLCTESAVELICNSHYNSDPLIITKEVSEQAYGFGNSYTNDDKRDTYLKFIKVIYPEAALEDQESLAVVMIDSGFQEWHIKQYCDSKGYAMNA